MLDGTCVVLEFTSASSRPGIVLLEVPLPPPPPNYRMFSIMIESFAGFRNLGWSLWSVRICRPYVLALLAFTVSIEKSGVILIGLFLHITLSFSLLMVFLRSVCLVFIICCGDFLFCFRIVVVLYTSCKLIGIFFFRPWEFSSIILFLYLFIVMVYILFTIALQSLIMRHQKLTEI